MAPFIGASPSDSIARCKFSQSEYSNTELEIEFRFQDSVLGGSMIEHDDHYEDKPTYQQLEEEVTRLQL
jgi:hypothetical protein